jgi:hypothetical protein
VVFMDDDMREPDTMTGSLALRQAHTGGCVFVGFSEDVDAEVFFAPRGRRPRIERDPRYQVHRRPGKHLLLAADQDVPYTDRTASDLLHERRY